MAWAVLPLLIVGAGIAHGQQLEPRAYSPAPVGLNIFGVATYFSSGGEVTDPASPIQNIIARVTTAMPYYGRTFDLLGRQASATVATPFANAEVHGDVNSAGRSIDRTGVVDPLVRLAVNLLGGPALTPQEFRQRKPETTLGASICRHCSLWSVRPCQTDQSRHEPVVMQARAGVLPARGRLDL